MEKWTIRRARPEEKSQLTALADRSFRYGDGWFVRNMAKMYAPERAFENDHLVMERDGVLCGMVAMNQQQFVVGDTALSCVGIGTVCTAPEYRGQGVLQRMLASALRTIDFLDADFSFLNGLYQRYHHFGFESCGIWYQTTVFARKDASYTFRPLTEVSPEQRLAIIRQHEDRPIYGKRPEHLLTAIGSQFGMCTSVVYKNGVFEGTIGWKAQQVEISELETTGDPEAVCAAFLAEQGIPSAQLIIPGYDRKMLSAFPKAERTPVNDSFPPKEGLMMRVRHFDRMLKAWFPMHVRELSLPDGELVLQLPDSRLLIAVRHGIGSVQPTHREPDVVLSHDEAVRFLFHPLGYAVNDAVDALAQMWFPLPFALMNGDEF